MYLIRTHKLLILSTLLTIVALGLASWIVQTTLKKEAKKEVGQSLHTVLETTHQAIQSWTNAHKSMAMILANTPEVRQATEEMLSVYHTHTALIGLTAQVSLRACFQLFDSEGYEGYFIIGPNNINLASSKKELTGQTNSLAAQQDFLMRLWSGTATMSLPIRTGVTFAGGKQNPRPVPSTMFVGAPIVDTSGNVIAIFVYGINPAADFTSILQAGRIGLTGETYAFDGTGRLISNSRFDKQLKDIGLLSKGEQAILNIEVRDPGVNLVNNPKSHFSSKQQPLTRMAANAIAGKSGMDLDGYRDYRGIPVVGAWLWDSDLGYGLTTELDVSEAYQTLGSTQKVISALTVFAMALVVGLTGIFIVNRRKILDSENRLRQIIDLVPSMIFARDWNGRFVLANKATAQAYGMTVEEITRAGYEKVVEKPDQIKAIMADDRQVLESGQTKILPEEPFVDAQGNRRVLQVVKIPYKSASLGGPAVLGVATDITERKLAEEKARRHQAELTHIARLGIMGEMGTGLAHELSQPLTSIYAYSKACLQMLRLGHDKSTEINNALVKIAKTAEQAGELIRHLRHFVRKEPSQKTEVDINELIQDTVDFIEYEVRRHNVTVFLELDRRLPTILADSIQIEQVLLNIVHNAIEAMRSSHSGRRELFIQTGLSRDKAKLQVEISDTGSGIDEKMLSRVFDPFQTTKSNGIGVGLSISRSIIDAHEGRLWVESKRGHGAKFFITLPLTLT